MITRSKRHKPRKPFVATGSYWPLIAGTLLSAAVVAITAFSASYQHQYELYIRYGQSHWVSSMLPLSVEGLIMATTLALWCAAVLRRQAREMWPAYLVLGAAIGQTVLMNLAADHRFVWPWIGPEISIWPAVAFVAAYEMSVWIYRNRPVTVNEGRTSELPEVPDPDPDEEAEINREIIEWDEPLPPTPEPEQLVSIPKLLLPEFKPVVTINGNAGHGRIVSPDKAPEEPVHTCNDGKGPKGGRKTPGCPRCDALLAGTVAPKGSRKG